MNQHELKEGRYYWISYRDDKDGIWDYEGVAKLHEIFTQDDSGEDDLYFKPDIDGLLLYRPEDIVREATDLEVAEWREMLIKRHTELYINLVNNL